MNDRINAALPGVAISVALVPPLASVGVCLGVGSWTLAGGALVLFLANFLAIELAAALVFTVYGLRRERHGSGFRRFVGSFGWSTLLLLVMSYFLYRALDTTIAQNRMRSEIRDVLGSLATEIPGAKLDSFNVEGADKTLEVGAVFLTPSAFKSESVAAIEGRLQREVDRRIHLVVRSLISSDADSEGPVYVPAARLREQQDAQRRAAYFTQLRATIGDTLAELPGAELANIFIPADAPETKVTAIVNTPTALAPEQVSAMQRQLRGATGRAVELTVRSLLTVDANGETYLYTPAKPPAPTAAEQVLIDRMKTAFKNQLSRRQSGAYLVSLTVENDEGRWKVRGICRSPSAITPDMVRGIEADVQQYVAPNIDLTVRTVLESDATSLGYLMGDDQG